MKVLCEIKVLYYVYVHTYISINLILLVSSISFYKRPAPSEKQTDSVGNYMGRIPAIMPQSSLERT